MQMRTEDTQLMSQMYGEIEQRFNHFDDPAHGWEHVRRVYNLAMYIAEQEGGDPFICGMGALLHDLGRLSHDEGQHHAELSASVARELLSTREIAPEAREAIIHAIVAHSFSLGVQPLTPEAYIVRDADRLDSLGAIGIMRWAITGAVRRSPETLTYHPDDPFAVRHAPNDHGYILDHFFTKLLKLADSVSTITGRRLALQRTAFMRAYLDEFRKELELTL